MSIFVFGTKWHHHFTVSSSRAHDRTFITSDYGTRMGTCQTSSFQSAENKHYASLPYKFLYQTDLCGARPRLPLCPPHQEALPLLSPEDSFPQSSQPGQHSSCSLRANSPWWICFSRVTLSSLFFPSYSRVRVTDRQVSSRQFYLDNFKKDSRKRSLQEGGRKGREELLTLSTRN